MLDLGVDLTRFAVAAAVMVGALTAIFALDLIPQKLDIKAGTWPGRTSSRRAACPTSASC
jgi:hypothetical protein